MPLKEEPFVYMEDSDSGDLSSEDINIEEEINELQSSKDTESDTQDEDSFDVIEDKEEFSHPIEEKTSPSILDLISRDKDITKEVNVEEEVLSPDLFTDNNIHELNSEKDEELINSEDDHVETDQDLLEIPSFLRRQSK